MSLEKHGPGVEQGWQMLNTFAGVGVRCFDVTETDLDGQKCNFRPTQKLELVRSWLSFGMASAIQHQRNVIVRPRGATVALVQLDDLAGMTVERVRGAAFLILTTSLNNYQAWVAVQDCQPDFARRLRQGCGADPSASGAARIAGSRNFKRRYAPNYPVITILEVNPQRIVTPMELEALGMVAAPEQRPMIPPPRVSPWARAGAWPSYERCLQNAPLAHHSDRPDVSRADFTFCLLAIDWGRSVVETCTKLLEKSSKARECGLPYARLTAERAAAAVHRRR